MQTVSVSSTEPSSSFPYFKNAQMDGAPGFGCRMWAKSRVDSHDSLIDSGKSDPKKLQSKKRQALARVDLNIALLPGWCRCQFENVNGIRVGGHC